MLTFEKLNNKKSLKNFKPLSKNYKPNQQNKEDKKDKDNKFWMPKLLKHQKSKNKKNVWRNQWNLNNI